MAYGLKACSCHLLTTNRCVQGVLVVACYAAEWWNDDKGDDDVTWRWFKPHALSNISLHTSRSLWKEFEDVCYAAEWYNDDAKMMMLHNVNSNTTYLSSFVICNLYQLRSFLTEPRLCCISRFNWITRKM